MSAQVDGPFPLDDYLRARRTRVDRALERALDELCALLPEASAPAVREGVTAGGKRLRPILCMAAYEAVTGGEAGAATNDGDPLAALAVSLELIHAYSLMHDDLPCMDDAPLRRGRPTPHTVHGEGPTATGGAALIPAAHLQAWRAAARMGLPEEVGREIVRALARAAGGGGMVGGQALDLLAEGQRLEQDRLDALHALKTGALLAASLRIGALAGRAPPATADALEGAGRAIGLAFQIADDVLDATADAASLGKEPSDQALDKSTYVALLGVEGARVRALALAREAEAALGAAGVRAPAIAALARYAVERRR